MDYDHLGDPLGDIVRDELDRMSPLNLINFTIAFCLWVTIFTIAWVMMP